MDAAQTVNQMVDQYRGQCLWFLRADYYPTTDEDRLRVLSYIERYGDREAFIRADAVRRCLSPSSSSGSAG